MGVSLPYAGLACAYLDAGAHSPTSLATALELDGRGRMIRVIGRCAAGRALAGSGLQLAVGLRRAAIIFVIRCQMRRESGLAGTGTGWRPRCRRSAPCLKVLAHASTVGVGEGHKRTSHRRGGQSKRD